jgi:EAL domain-containing protein (putative c-di-GMP-specific phosphodiesterase class I)
MDVVAEGVETADQFRYLSAQDCRTFQGFYFARPMTSTEFGSRLAERRPAGPR